MPRYFDKLGNYHCLVPTCVREAIWSYTLCVVNVMKRPVEFVHVEGKDASLLNKLAVWMGYASQERGSWWATSVLLRSPRGPDPAEKYRAKPVYHRVRHGGAGATTESDHDDIH